MRAAIAAPVALAVTMAMLAIPVTMLPVAIALRAARIVASGRGRGGAFGRLAGE